MIQAVIADLRVCPPSQIATGVNPWINARWAPSEASAKEGTLRRVPPHEAWERCCGRKAVGLHRPLLSDVRMFRSLTALPPGARTEKFFARASHLIQGRLGIELKAGFGWNLGNRLA